jgi:putative aminopeptidase FrvX
MPFDTVVTKTIEYLAVPSVVGHEGIFIDFLKQDFEKLGINVTAHKGVLELSGKAPRSAIISAHIDRHGLISMGEGHYGYAAEYIKENKYDVDGTPTQKMLINIGERFNGEEVFAYDSTTGSKLGEGIISHAGPEMIDNNCIFKIEGMADLPPNIPLAYARTAVSDGDYLKGQIDNVVSLGVIYALYQNGFQGTALLSCEEEIGQSWRHIQNWLEQQSIETKELIIIDTSPYREVAPVEGGVVVLRNRDKSAVFDTVLTEKIKQRCVDKLMPFQCKDEYLTDLGTDINGLGSTELGRIIQNSDNRWSGTTVQIPTTEYHTSYETTSRESIENYFALLQNILINEPIITGA